MIIASVKITPDCLLIFTSLLDDIWYYKYHRAKYPSSLKFFVKEVNIINELRLNPWFLDFIEAINKNYVFNDINDQRYASLNFSNNDPTQVYFLHATEDVYRNNFVLNLLIFLLLKLCFLIFAQLFRVSGQSFLKSARNAFKHNSRWWVLLMAMVESNMIKLTFSSFIQILQSGIYIPQDKLNLIAAYLVLFCMLVYSLCFYPLLYLSERKPYSSTLLVKSKYTMHGFYLECFGLVLRSFVRSSIHGLFI
jgi:hypothetical protein